MFPRRVTQLNWPSHPHLTNQRLPSGPVVMPAVCSMMALSLRGGRAYSVKLPLVVIRRMLLGPPVSDNPPAHSAPSGPAAMAKSTKVDEIGLGYSVIDPVVVMRPTLL